MMGNSPRLISPTAKQEMALRFSMGSWLLDACLLGGVPGLVSLGGGEQTSHAGSNREREQFGSGSVDGVSRRFSFGRHEVWHFSQD